MHPTKQGAKRSTTPSGNPGAGTRADVTITRSSGNRSDSRTDSRTDGRTNGRKNPGEFNWVKFWIEMGIYALIFNIVAGLITWYYIFPKLHLR